MRSRARVFLVAVVAVGLLLGTVSPALAAGWHFETLDGSGGSGGRIDRDVGQFTSTLLYGGAPHSFYRNAQDGTLRHAWWTGTRWAFETLDGVGGLPGSTGNDVGADVKAIVLYGTPHAFYYDVTAGNLRHAWWTGSRWAFETLDGAGGVSGRVNRDVGTDVSVTTFASSPHVFFYDVGSHDLRHGWWTGSTWVFETLDGSSTTGGRTGNDVGQYSAVVLHAELPHVFYYDDTNATLRHAWWTGTTWMFETLDGNAPTGGRTAASVGSDISVLLFDGLPHVWYYDIEDKNLRHAWWTGRAWAYETLDGAGGGGSRINADVGMYATAVLYGRTPHVFSRDEDNKALRHAWWTGSQWAFETLDVGDVGWDGSVIVFGIQLDVLYYQGAAGNLRHAFYN